MRKMISFFAFAALLAGTAFSQEFLIDFSSDFSGRIFIDGEAKARIKQGKTKRLTAKSDSAKISLVLDDGFETSRSVKLSAGINRIRVSQSDRYWKGEAAKSGEISGFCGVSPKFSQGDIVAIQTAENAEIHVKIIKKAPLDDEQIILLSDEAMRALELHEGGTVAVRKVFIWN